MLPNWQPATNTTAVNGELASKKNLQKNRHFFNVPIFFPPSRSQWITLCLGKEKLFGPWPDLEAANHLHRCITSSHIRDMVKLLLCVCSEMWWMVVCLYVLSPNFTLNHTMQMQTKALVCVLCQRTQATVVCAYVWACVCALCAPLDSRSSCRRS